MEESTLDGAWISQLVWDAAAAAAVGDHHAAQQIMAQLVDADDDGTSLRIASTGWAALIAEHICSGVPGYRFKARLEQPDDKTEIFAAIVCAVGNRDCPGAMALLEAIGPIRALDVATLLLYGAGSVLGSSYRSGRRP
jgi:hypothetical protein